MSRYTMRYPFALAIGGAGLVALGCSVFEQGAEQKPVPSVPEKTTDVQPDAKSYSRPTGAENVDARGVIDGTLSALPRRSSVGESVEKLRSDPAIVSSRRTCLHSSCPRVSLESSMPRSRRGVSIATGSRLRATEHRDLRSSHRRAHPSVQSSTRWG